MVVIPSVSRPVLAAIILGSFLVVVAIGLRFVGWTHDMSGSQEVSAFRPADFRHRYGSNDADTVIVEFADYACGYCAGVHETYKRIVDESNGSVAWEYRHLPILKTVSYETAIAAECVALRSEDPNAFWQFSNDVFHNQQGLSGQYASDLAKRHISDAQVLEDCMRDANVAKLVIDDKVAARDLGAQGTPFSVIVKKDGTTSHVAGALPYNEWTKLLQVEQE